MSPIPSHPVRQHVIPFLIGLVMLLVAVGGLLLGEKKPLSLPAQIVIEHAKPLTVTLSVSTLTGGVLVNISQSGPEATHVSVPSSWKRTEVQRASLATVTSDPPGLGFLRWALPAGAGISFTAEAFSSLSLENPSSTPLQLNVISVDGRTNRVTSRSLLITDGPVVVQ